MPILNVVKCLPSQKLKHRVRDSSVEKKIKIWNFHTSMYVYKLQLKPIIFHCPIVLSTFLCPSFVNNFPIFHLTDASFARINLAIYIKRHGMKHIRGKIVGSRAVEKRH